MTTLADRTAAALLVVDVQNDVVDGAFRRDTVVANIARLVEQAREQEVAVVWVRHHDDELRHGSDGWQIVPELSPPTANPSSRRPTETRSKRPRWIRRWPSAASAG